MGESCLAERDRGTETRKKPMKFSFGVYGSGGQVVREIADGHGAHGGRNFYSKRKG